MDTLTGYPRRVARAKWTPPNPELAARIDKAVRLFKRQQEVEAEYRRAIAELAQDEVPIAHLAERLGVERKTVYRHLGHEMR